MDTITKRSGWLTLTASVLLLIGAQYAISSLWGLGRLWDGSPLPDVVAGDLGVNSGFRSLLAMTAFHVCLSVIFIISCFGCLKRRAFQGRFLGTVGSFQMVVLNFGGITILGHYRMVLFVSTMIGLAMIWFLNITCRDEFASSPASAGRYPAEPAHL